MREGNEIRDESSCELGRDSTLFRGDLVSNVIQSDHLSNILLSFSKLTRTTHFLYEFSLQPLLYSSF